MGDRSNEINVLFKHFNAKHVILVDDPQPNSNRIYIKYRPDAQKPALNLNIQTPKMRIPFGLSDNRAMIKGADDFIKRYIDMSFFGENDNDSVNPEAKNLKIFREKMKELDDRVIDLLLEGKYMDKFCDSEVEWNRQSISWAFNKAIRAFKPSKKSKMDGTADAKKYPDTFRIPVPWKYDKNNKNDPGTVADVTFWDEGKPPKQLSIDDVKKLCSGRALVNFQSLTFVGGKAVYYSKKLRQLQITPARERLTGFQFQPDEEDSEQNKDPREEDEDLLVDESEEGSEGSSGAEARSEGSAGPPGSVGSEGAPDEEQF